MLTRPARFAPFHITLLAMVLLLSCGVRLGTAQQAGIPPDASHNSAAFAPLDLPTPNRYRAASGQPGEAYWQQRADYQIEATLDPATHRLSGTVAIQYTNNSPLPLAYLWLQLDQNLFAPDSRSARLQPPRSRWRGSFEAGGYTIDDVAVVVGGTRLVPDVLIDDTRLRLILDEPLAPGRSLRIEVAYAFVVPEYGADRMGRLEVEQGTVYEFAQWYPRMFVFDDVNGWNALPYLGQGEFYLDYGTYELALTVPRDFIVVATGELLNPDEVLTRRQQERLNRARSSEKTVYIVEPNEVGRAGTRPVESEMLTWRYRAEDVRDVAWATSQAFIWDAASWNGVLLQSAYPKEGLGNARAPGWEASTQYVRHAIQHYSDMWHPYPYPVAINVAGIVGGMEYPMIVFCSVSARDQALFGVTDHEFAHQWFPMLVGSDERRHAWMDEGFTTFLGYYSNLAFYGEEAENTSSIRPDYIAGRMQESLADQPIGLAPDQIRREGLGFLAYRKPAMGLRILREYVLGPERFDPAFRAYIDRWAYKHPQPADFFRTIEDVAGENLDWFWRGWIYGTDTFDQAIEGVAANSEGTTYIKIVNRGLVLPAELALTYADGTSERIRVPVEAFMTGDDFLLTVDRDDVQTVQLDPDGILPDVDRSNDTWRREGTD